MVSRIGRSVALSGIAAIFFAGCSAQSPAVVRLQENVGKEKLIWASGRERVGCVSALAFHPNGRQLFVGDGIAGTVSLWTIAASSPDQIIGSGSGAVSSTAVSVDGKFLAWSFLPSVEKGSGATTFSESKVRVQNLSTGEVKSVTAGFQYASVLFSPTSDFLAIDTLKELRVVDAGSGNSILSYQQLNGPGGPIVFYERNGILSLLGWNHRWILTADSARLQNDPPTIETPAAVIPGGDLAYFIKGPTFANESNWLAPGMVLSSGGLGIGPTDGSRYDTLLRFRGHGDMFPSQLGYIPNTGRARNKLVATLESGLHNRRDVVLIDVMTGQYHSLLPLDWPRRRDVNYVWAISSDGKLLAVGWPEGLIVWELP